MIKKIILGVIVFGISAGLIYGGVHRTIARTETEERANQSERDLSLSQGKSEEGNLGQGKNRTSGSNEQQGGKNESGSDHAASDKELKDKISFTGIVTQVNEELLVILCERGDEIVTEGRALRFATEVGFSAEIGDSITLIGFYEDADKFEVSYIENLTQGVKVQIREESGRPFWAGNGRGA
jgi:hypothetical protein